MRLLLACGRDGLLEYRFTALWRSLPCLLRAPSLICREGGCIALADNQAHELWAGGRVTHVEGDLEALLLWRGRALTLSGNTGCVTMLDLVSGLPMITTPVGVSPQGMCLLSPRLLAVCGGADRTLYLLSPADLTLVRRIPLRGQPQRVAWSDPLLYVLCDVSSDASLCQLLSIDRHGSIRTVAQLPGAAGALCPAERGGVWCAAGEALARFSPAQARPDVTLAGFSVVSSLHWREGMLAVCDAGSGECVLLTARGDTVLRLRGDACQALLV